MVAAGRDCPSRPRRRYRLARRAAARRAGIVLISVLCRAGAAAAQAQPPEQIVVIGTTPLLGSGVDQNRVPGQSAVLGSQDIARDGTPDLLHALDTQVAGVNLDSASGNPFQPSLFYNGFEASPLQGTAQGLAVYVNGVRFNQAFGDTVNWDLIPNIAIDRLNVEGSNPVFGLNALGGSVSARLRNGFTYHGAEADLSGGSFGQVQGEFQYGAERDGRALYVAGNVLNQDGWRDTQSSDIQNGFADLGWRGSKGEVHLGLALGNTVLNGPGSAPIQLIQADARAQFTQPNLIANKFGQLSLSGSARLDDTVSVDGEFYASTFLQRVANGNVAGDLPCGGGSTLLCSAPGVPSTTRGGGTVTDFLHGGPYAALDLATTDTNAYGASVQATDTGAVWGRGNHLVVGASFDGAQTVFSDRALIGGLLPSTREFIGPGITIDEPGINVPVRVAVSDTYAGAFAADTLDVTRHLAVTVSARLNSAEIDLADRGGGRLTGQHAYTAFNPAAGATYTVAPWLTLYAGLAQANRAPTPAELSCAGPADACSLANFFVGDPNLKQVVAHTIEAGARGRARLPDAVRVTYSLGLFRTDALDDIVFINSAVLGRAYFANIGQTRRQGLSARLELRRGAWSARISTTYTQAEFRTGFSEAAGNNPAASGGMLQVQAGDRLPGIPAIVLKAGTDLQLTPQWTAGLEAVQQSGQVLFGDEPNLTPRLPGFFRLDLHSAYQLTAGLQLFASVQNATMSRIYTFGTFSPTASVFLAQAPGATNPRSYSLAAPLGVVGGVRATF